MPNLTLQEMIILIVALAAVISLVVSLIKHSVRIALTVCLIVVLFSGFTWVPEQVKIWLDNINNPTEVIDPDMQVDYDWEATIKDIGEDVKVVVDKNKGTWIESAKSLWAKITGTFEDSSSETNTETNQ